jgi:adenylosuccinate lyase
VRGDGGADPADLEAIRAATFTVEAAQERERITDHDVAAFVDVLSASAGDAGRWIHFGLTRPTCWTPRSLSSCATPGRSCSGARASWSAPWPPGARARGHADGRRTHGIQAEPTTFGVKLAGFAFEAHRNAERLERAIAQVSVGALSGAVGTYAATSPDFEQRVLARLGLAAEDVSTQVVPRDRHAELLQAIALAGRGPRAVRHRDPPPAAHRGARGRGAVPRRQAEGLVGDAAQAQPDRLRAHHRIARLLRGYAQTGLENVALWHERDISHSGAERVALPDATILVDYAQSLALRLASGMVVHEDRMRENLEITHGALYSQRALLALVQSGMTRDDAYRVVQENAQRAWDERTPFRDLLAQALPAGTIDVDAVFDPRAFTRHARESSGGWTQSPPRAILPPLTRSHDLKVGEASRFDTDAHGRVGSADEALSISPPLDRSRRRAALRPPRPPPPRGSTSSDLRRLTRQPSGASRRRRRPSTRSSPIPSRRPDRAGHGVGLPVRCRDAASARRLRTAGASRRRHDHRLQGLHYIAGGSARAVS